MRLLLGLTAAIVVLVTPAGASAQVLVFFSSTPGTHTYTVPAGVTELDARAVGGAGGRGFGEGGASGGRGAVAQAILPVTPGETLTLVVGGSGADGTSDTAGAGGSNGGAPATARPAADGAGGGGGASDVRRGGSDLDDRVLVGAGGGGGGASALGAFPAGQGGHAGGTTGAAGGNGPDDVSCGSVCTPVTVPGGGGGTPAAGGSAGLGAVSDVDPLPGVLGLGGDGGRQQPPPDGLAVGEGGGGGGGLHGGGGGGAGRRGGAGGGAGSSFGPPGTTFETLNFVFGGVVSLRTVDRTGPVTTLTADPASPDGDGGWYRTAPTVTAAATDAGTVADRRCALGAPAGATYADLVAASAPATCPVPGEGTSVFRAAAKDAAGNAGDAVGLTVKVDSVNPGLDLPADLERDATSPAGAVVTFTATATDGTSGPADPAATCAPASGSTFPAGTTTTVTCTAADVAGNTTQGSFDVTVGGWDATAPTTTLTAVPAAPDGANGWYRTAPVVSAAATDGGGSGVARTRCTTAALPADAGYAELFALTADLTCPAVATDGVRTFRAASVDENGNAEDTAPSLTVKVDRTGPVLALPVRTVDATSPAGAVVTFTVPATDATSGLASPTAACIPGSGGTFGAGQVTVTCSATDLAGNRTIDTFVVTVRGATAQLQSLRDALVALPVPSRPVTALVDAAIRTPRNGCAVLPAVRTLLAFMRFAGTPTGTLDADVRRIQAVLGCR